MGLVRAQGPGAVGSGAQPSRFPGLFNVSFTMDHEKLERRWGLLGARVPGSDGRAEQITMLIQCYVHILSKEAAAISAGWKAGWKAGCQ